MREESLIEGKEGSRKLSQFFLMLQIVQWLSNGHLTLYEHKPKPALVLFEFTFLKLREFQACDLKEFVICFRDAWVNRDAVAK